MADFTYCLNTSTIKPAGMLEKIRIAAEAGYGAIELWHEDMDAYVRNGASLEDLKKALADGGLRVPTTIYIKGWFESEGEEHRRVLEECRRRMRQGAEVGARYVIAGPPAGVADHDRGAEHYRELLAIGREIGIKPAMEFLGFVEDINTIEDGWEVVEKAGDPDGTIVLDPFHIFRGGGDPESIAKIPGERIAIFHFNDAPANLPREQQHDRNRVYPGDGHLDLKHMVQLVRGTGFRGCISLELFNEILWQQDPLEVAQVGLEKMRSVVES